MSRTERRLRFDGVRVYGGYESPFIRTGIPIIASRQTDFLKPEFFSWFTNYAKNNTCELSPANLAFVNEIFQQKTETIERNRTNNKKSLRFSLIVPIAILLLGIIVGSSRVSFQTAITATVMILFAAVPPLLMTLLPRAALSKIKHKQRSDEVNVVTDAIRNRNYTAYRLTVTEKKWSESSYSDEDSSGKSYTSYYNNFYVDVGDLTLEVDTREYDNMKVGGAAIVVIFHTTAGEAMCVFAPRG